MGGCSGVLIRSEYGSPVFWRMFNPGDRLFWVGVKEGTVAAGTTIGPLSHPEGRFKLELKRSGLGGPFLSSAGAIYNQGDAYVLRADGRLEPDVPQQPPAPPSVRRVVAGFDIAVHGFPFPNSFPASSFPVQELLGFPVAQRYGLCGGMAYATRDCFETGIPVPGTAQPPIGGRVFDWLWQRLLDSFNLPFGAGAPPHYLLLQSPALADAGPPTAFGVLSRMGEMIRLQWPRVRDTIDQGRLCPIAVVYVKTPNPGDIFQNHQVTVFGYEIAESLVTLLINDPNVPRVEQRLTIDVSDENVFRLGYSAQSPVWAFFATDYLFKRPWFDGAPARGWDSGWRSVGRIIVDSPELVSMRPSNVAIFGRGIENALWWGESNDGGPWGNWTSLGGTITSSPGGASWANGRMDIFARGAAGSLVHTWRINNAWTGDWDDLGGQIVGGPDACSWGPNRLDVFVRGTDNALHHIWYEHSWGSWESLGGELSSDPTAVCWGNGRIDVFARDADQSLVHRWYDGNWHDWESLGGVLSSAPDVASWGPNRLDVFVRGTDNALWTLVYDGNWHGWTSLGGAIISDPTSVGLGPDRLAVVAAGLDLGLWIKNYS